MISDTIIFGHSLLYYIITSKLYNKNLKIFALKIINFLHHHIISVKRNSAQLKYYTSTVQILRWSFERELQKTPIRWRTSDLVVIYTWETFSFPVAPNTDRECVTDARNDSHTPVSRPRINPQWLASTIFDVTVKKPWLMQIER